MEIKKKLRLTLWKFWKSLQKMSENSEKKLLKITKKFEEIIEKLRGVFEENCGEIFRKL